MKSLHYSCAVIAVAVCGAAERLHAESLSETETEEVQSVLSESEVSESPPPEEPRREFPFVREEKWANSSSPHNRLIVEKLVEATARRVQAREAGGAAARWAKNLIPLENHVGTVYDEAALNLMEDEAPEEEETQ